MIATVLFDTLTYANKLKAAGMPTAQAEVQVEMLAEVVSYNLATKQDLTEVKQQLEIRLAELKNELVRWVLGISFAQAAVIISCLKLIP